MVSSTSLKTSDMMIYKDCKVKTQQGNVDCKSLFLFYENCVDVLTKYVVNARIMEPVQKIWEMNFGLQLTLNTMLFIDVANTEAMVATINKASGLCCEIGSIAADFLKNLMKRCFLWKTRYWNITNSETDIACGLTPEA